MNTHWKRFMWRNRHVSLSLLTLLMFGLLSLLPYSPVAAQDFGGVCQGVAFTGDQCDAPGQAVAQRTISETIRRGIDIFTIIVGIISVIMIVYSGFKYITSGGDAGKISSAQSTIIYAIVGLIVAALAQVIARFVITQLD